MSMGEIFMEKYEVVQVASDRLPDVVQFYNDVVENTPDAGKFCH